MGSAMAGPGAKPGAGPGLSGAERQRIGSLLLARGAVSAARLAEALDLQRQSGIRLGTILVRRGWADPLAVAQAAAEQAGVDLIDPEAAPPDPALLDPRDLDLLLSRRVAPWRRLEDTVVFVAADADAAADTVARLAEPPASWRLALAEPAALDRALGLAWGPALSARAATRTPEPLSARAPAPLSQKTGFVLVALAVATGLFLAPTQTGLALFLALVCVNALNAAARIAVLAFAIRAPRDPAPPEAPPGATVLAERRAQPCVTLLIPLLREPETLPVLLEALEGLDWPPERLDVKLILEAEDDVTRSALERLRPPPFVSVLVAPPGLPRTKPRALNFALDFTDSEIVGIYDAEDRPERDQLRRIAAILRDADPETACVQCRLGYYNPAENWLTRCFAIEYAMWFDVLLRGFRALRLPIPLGGTSVFFRRAALERLGGWDAHNVTEDADLGMRLARAGMRCEVSVSTTHEEANSRVAPWMRQRSRWLKGYMQTWLVHMRDPLALMRELGLRGFVGFQTVFLGALVAYLGLPLFWAIWAMAMIGHGPAWLDDAPLWAMLGVAAVQLAGWVAMLIAAVIATARRGQAWLQPWIPTLAFYWPLGAMAAYLALGELFLAPALWRKTPHGMGAEAARLRQDALRARGMAAGEETAVQAAE